MNADRVGVNAPFLPTIEVFEELAHGDDLAHVDDAALVDALTGWTRGGYRGPHWMAVIAELTARRCAIEQAVKRQLGL